MMQWWSFQPSKNHYVYILNNKLPAPWPMKASLTSYTTITTQLIKTDRCYWLNCLSNGCPLMTMSSGVGKMSSWRTSLMKKASILQNTTQSSKSQSVSCISRAHLGKQWASSFHKSSLWLSTSEVLIRWSCLSITSVNPIRFSYWIKMM